MKRLLFWILLLMPLAALAEGEQRDIKGATWVKPVEFFDLAQKKFYTVEVFRRPSVFVTGKFDINEFANAKDIQIVGMKLKPKCACGTQVLFMLGPNLEDDNRRCLGHFDNKSFCIYSDESVNKNFEFDYFYGDAGSAAIVEANVHCALSINDLQLVQTRKGLGIHYGWNCAYTVDGEAYNTDYSNGGFTKGEYESPIHSKFSVSRPAKVEVDSLVSFISDSKHVSMILWHSSKRNEEHFYTDHWGDEWKWDVRPFIGFEVEEILVADPGTVVVTPPSGSKGFDKHTTAAESAVVSIIGLLLALLLGGLSGGIGGIVPPVSSGAPPTSSVDPSKFTPTQYPDYCDRYITQQPDGDVVMRSPVTGQEEHYYSNGDGTWFSASGMTYTAQDIEERLRYEAENDAVLRRDAWTAAHNEATQRAAWDAQNARDLARGYSDEQKEYMDLKKALEDQLKHEEYLDKMAEKYHVLPTDKAVKEAIKFEQLMNKIDADTHSFYAKDWDQGLKIMENVDKKCEIAVNVMSACVPGGDVVKNAYTFAKSTLVAANESVAEGKSASEGLAHVLVGMGKGALGVIQNEAGNMTKDANFAFVKEWSINVVTEDLKEGLDAIAEGKSLDEIGQIMLTTTGKKSAEFLTGKAISAGFGAVKNTAKASLNPDGVAEGQFSFNVSTAKRIDYWLNQTHRVGIGPKTSTINVSVGPKGFNMWKGAGFKYFSGKLDTGGLVEGSINEALSQNDAFDWGGDFAEWANQKGVDATSNLMYGADEARKTAINFAKEYDGLNSLATAYSRNMLS